MVTPNLDDTLKDLWRNEAFGRFFYDEHAINYLTATTVDRMLARVHGRQVRRDDAARLQLRQSR